MALEASFISLDITGLIENGPAIAYGDRLYVRLPGQDPASRQTMEFEGYVYEMNESRVNLVFSNTAKFRVIVSTCGSACTLHTYGLVANVDRNEPYVSAIFHVKRQSLSYGLAYRVF